MTTDRDGPPRRAAFDPDVAQVLAMIASSARPSFDQMPLSAARDAYRAGTGTSALPPLPLAEVRDLDLAGVPARLYRPAATTGMAAGPGLVFLHGGGWVIGDLDTHDSICRHLAQATARTVIALDYRLAPEAPLPAAYDDCAAAWAAILADAETLGLAPDNLAMAGDSAGGAMAAMLAITAVNHGLTPPCAVLLFYPVLDLAGETPSYEAVADVPFTASTMRWFLDLALRGQIGGDRLRQDLSPLRARSLAGFPPTFMTSCGHDPLCDEAFLFAARLRQAGIPFEHRHVPGHIHGYLTLGGLIGEAARSIAAAAAFLTNRSFA